jgi:glucan phosphoethanolaminetransferase (alkaline phosphatase superfamily)
MSVFFKKIINYLTEKKEVNYIYFSILLIGLFFFSFSHFLLLEHPPLGMQLFFLLYALLQALMETWVLVLIACILRKWAPLWAFKLFIGLSFLLLLAHFTHFTMMRLMDISIVYPIKFLFGFKISHLFTAFRNLNMNLGMLTIILLSFLLIPLGGLLFYWGTSHLTNKKPWNLSLTQVTSALMITLVFLFSLDLLAHPYVNQITYKKYQKVLPFGRIFLEPASQYAHLVTPLAMPPLESEIQKQIGLIKKQDKKPNIYFFVIETLRKDFVVQEVAPHLTHFGEENIAIESSYANANSTQLSWFSIFYSQFPFHWTSIRDNWHEGAPSLQLLKQLGYTTHIYSASDFLYFGIDQILLGENRKLVDHMEEFALDRTIEPCDRDILCFNALKKNLSQEEGRKGQAYFIFLDSTHSEYSFPKDFPLKFNPSAKTVDYLTLNAKEVAPLQNRYRNAICYVDSLMGHFFHLLKEINLYDDAIIAITGDHGEEFFEQNSLFHGTHLNRYQIEVPIFLKCPGKTSLAKEASHLDIFPSLFHHITNISDFQNLFQGSSIFTQNRSPYTVSVMQNAGDTPHEFLIKKGNNKLHLRLLSSEDIYHQTKAEIISLELEDKEDFLSLISFPHARENLVKISE